MMVLSCYFEGGNLVFVREEDFLYGIEDETPVFNENTMSRAAERKLYFRGGKLVRLADIGDNAYGPPTIPAAGSRARARGLFPAPLASRGTRAHVLRSERANRRTKRRAGEKTALTKGSAEMTMTVGLFSKGGEGGGEGMSSSGSALAGGQFAAEDGHGAG